MAIVTGASGWLGQPLVRALAARGTRVRCLVQDPLAAAVLEIASPQIETVVGDVRAPADLDRLFHGADEASVFHAASVIHPNGTTREFFDINVGGTALALDRARRAGVSRFVYVSSNSPFGTNASQMDRFDEDAPYKPALGYGRSKMEAELLVRRSAEVGDVQTVIIRCPWFYGPFQPPRQTRFFELVRRGIFPLMGNGENRRSLAYVDNLVQGLILAELTERAAGRSYWIADAEPYTMREIVGAVRAAFEAEGLSVSRRHIRLPAMVSGLAKKADGALQGMGRYSSQLHVLGEMRSTIACSVERARTELGYHPNVSLNEGMRRSVRWCIDRGDLV